MTTSLGLNKVFQVLRALLCLLQIVLFQHLISSLLITLWNCNSSGGYLFSAWTSVHTATRRRPSVQHLWLGQKVWVNFTDLFLINSSSLKYTVTLQREAVGENLMMFDDIFYLQISEGQYQNFLIWSDTNYFLFSQYWYRYRYFCDSYNPIKHMTNSGLFFITLF